MVVVIPDSSHAIPDNRILMANGSGSVVGSLVIEPPVGDGALPTEKKVHGGFVPLSLAFPEIRSFDPSRLSISTMRKMRRDPMIAFGLTFIKAPLFNALWTINCDNPQIKAFVEWSIRKIYHKLLSAVLVALEFGYEGCVIRFAQGRPQDVWIDEEGKKHKVWTKQVDCWYPYDVFTLDPEMAEPIFEDGGLQRFIGIRAAGHPDIIPVPNAVWYTNDRSSSFGSYYGYPRTGYAYPYWRSYWMRWIIGDRHFETDADPPMVVYYPAGKSNVPGEGIVPNMELAKRLGESVRSGASIAIPSEPYQNEDGRVTLIRRWEAMFLRGGENIRAHNESFEYLDVAKLRAVMVPEQALIEGKGGSGSRNTSSVVAESFQDSQRVLMDDIDAYVFTPLAQVLAALHFERPPDVRKVTTGFLSEDIALARDVILQLARVDPQSLNLDVRELVSMVGLPSNRTTPHDATPPSTEDLMPQAGGGGRTAPPGAATGQGGGNNRSGQNQGGRPRESTTQPVRPGG